MTPAERVPYIYTPDEYFDMGAAGEHPPEFLALIGEDYINGKHVRSVDIKRVVVKIKFDGIDVQELDITPKIVGGITCGDWEEEIFKSYKASKQAEWNSPEDG